MPSLVKVELHNSHLNGRSDSVDTLDDEPLAVVVATVVPAEFMLDELLPILVTSEGFTVAVVRSGAVVMIAV